MMANRAVAARDAKLMPPSTEERTRYGSRRSQRLHKEIASHDPEEAQLPKKRRRVNGPSLEAGVAKDPRRVRDEKPAEIAKLPKQSRARRPWSTPFWDNGALTESHIRHWVAEHSWPTSYKDDPMNYLLARRRSTPSLARKRSNPSIVSASSAEDPQSEGKPALYRNPSYPTFLADNVTNYKSYLRDHELGMTAESQRLMQKLLKSPQDPPLHTLFQEDVFEIHMMKVKGKNESRILQDISPLLVPSVEALASMGRRYPIEMTESVNEGWNNCFPITLPRPQPDSAFGFAASSFTDDQMNKLRPMLGDASFSSYFKATYYMIFPFLTKEVKTGTMGLGIADNQNAHSMTIAVRAVVELFRLVGREQELHREVVALAVSHDDESVRIYAHYAFIDGEKISIWRHTVNRFYIDAQNRWKAWTFTKNVFDIFADLHLKRIQSAIEDISPELFHERSAATGSQRRASESSGLSQPLEQQVLVEQANTPEILSTTPNTSIETSLRSPGRKESRSTLR